MHLISLSYDTFVRRGILLWVCPAVWAANIPLTVVGSTETQIIVNYTAPSAAACTIVATDNNGGPAVADVDASKFSGANSDLGRTAANGFRWPTLIAEANSLNRTLFIGGHDEVKLASDGKWFSTALQVNSDHTITVTCGSDSGSIHASTKNLPAGSTYPEQIIPDTRAPMGGFPQPDVDWANIRAWKSTDPITGMLWQGVIGPKDSFRSDSTINTVFKYALDPSGSAWTNPQNALTNQVSGTLASTSTQNAPLFLAPDYFSWYCCGIVISDIQVFPYGKATGSQATVGHYLTNDSCTTKLTREIDQSFDTASAHVQGPGVPSTALSGFLNAWSPFSPNGMIGDLDLSNVTYNGSGGKNVVNASGSVITLTGRDGSGFPMRAPGSKLQIKSCSTGENVDLTVAHTDSPERITVVETGLNHTNCTYQDRGFGLCVELKSPGTVSLSETVRVNMANADDRGTNGAEYVCAPSKVTDISTGVDGTAYNPPMSGYLCAFHDGGNGKVVLIQDDGKVGLQSVLSRPGAHSNAGLKMPLSPWVDARTLMLSQSYSTNIWRISKDNSGNYTEYVPGTTFPDDRFTYTNIMDGATPLLTQVQNAGGKCADHLAKGIVVLGGLQSIAAGYSYYYIGAGSGDTHGGYAFFDSNNHYVGCTLGWDSYPLRNGAMHQAPEAVGKYAIAMFGNQFANYNAANVLGGPFVLQPTGAYRKNGTWTNYMVPVTAATNANPVRLTAPNNDLQGWIESHPPFTSPWMTISGGAGSWAALNGVVRATRVDNSSFTLTNTAGQNIDSTGWGAYSGGMSLTMTPALWNLRIASVATDSGTAKITVIADTPFTSYFPSGTPHLQDGDSLVISNISKHTAYYAKVSCSGCSQTSFQIWANPALTTPVSAASLNASVNHSIANAEACPALSTLSLPGPIVFDPDGGPGQSPTQVRCFVMQFAGEPCSYWAGSAESAAYPCSQNPQSYTSEITTVQPGDVLYDVGHPFSGYGSNNHEHFLVLAKDTTTHPGKIDLTLMRWYGDGINPVQSTHDDHLYVPGITGSNWYAYNHSPGWTPYLFPTSALALIDASNPSTVLAMPPPYTSMHIDIVNMPTNGYASTISGWANSIDGVFNKPISAIPAIPPTFQHDNTPVWSPASSYELNQPSQSYPSGRHLVTAPERERVWAGDWGAMNNVWGYSPNHGDANFNGLSLTPVPGTLHVFKINNASGATNIKVQPYISVSPGFMYGTDISSRTSGDVITDSKPYTQCYAYTAGECRQSSNAGEWYISMPGGWNANNYYYSNQFFWPIPILFAPTPWAGWAFQTRQNPVDRQGKGTRRLTLGNVPPFTHMSFQNWRPSVPGPGGSTWGFFAMNPWRSRLRFQEAAGSTWLLGKVPPWPDTDTTNRGAFVQTPVKVSGNTGDTVRVAFGYGENGDPSSLYCTQRRETCWTTANPTAADPFVFAGETQAKTPCPSACTVNIPAIAGRIVFYRIERTTSSGVVTGPVQAIAVP